MRINQMVERLLKFYPELRDNDNMLMAKLWECEWGEFYKLSHLTAEGFLSEFAKGRFTSPESIRRSRQLLQQKNMSLRGSRYYERLKKGEDERRYFKG